MGIYYDLYLEGRVGDDWRCLTPVFSTAEGVHKLAPLMSGKSVVGMMLDNIGCWHSCPKDLSAEVRHVLWRKHDAAGNRTDEIEEGSVEWFFMSDVSCDPARYEHEAYVPRETANAFEIGEVDEIWDWLTPQEYGALPSGEKQAYMYYRWTQPYGPYDMKCRLKRLAEDMKTMYRETILLHEEGLSEVAETRIIVRLG